MSTNLHLPLPDVVELDLEDVWENLEKLRTIGENSTVVRSDELNAALAALPIMHQFVGVLKNWAGDSEELPGFESVMNKVSVFNDIITTSIFDEINSGT